MSRRSRRPRKYQAMLEYHVDICPKQRKRIYNSLKEVRTVLNSIKAKRGKEAATRYYHCEHCEGWHMTRITEELQKEIVEMRTNRPSLLFESIWKQTLNNQKTQK